MEYLYGIVYLFIMIMTILYDVYYIKKQIKIMQNDIASLKFENKFLLKIIEEIKD